MAGRESHKGSQKKKGHNYVAFIELALWGLVSRPQEDGGSLVTWESCSEARSQRGPTKLAAAAAATGPQQGRHSRCLRGMPSAPLGG